MPLDGIEPPRGRPYVYQWPNPDKDKPKVEEVPPPKVIEKPYRAGDEIYHGTMRLIKTAIIGYIVIACLPGLLVFLILGALAYFGS